MRLLVLRRTLFGSLAAFFRHGPTVVAMAAVVLDDPRLSGNDVLPPHESDDAAMDARSLSRQGKAFYARGRVGRIARSSAAGFSRRSEG